MYRKIAEKVKAIEDYSFRRSRRLYKVVGRVDSSEFRYAVQLINKGKLISCLEKRLPIEEAYEEDDKAQSFIILRTDGGTPRVPDLFKRYGRTSAGSADILPFVIAFGDLGCYPGEPRIIVPNPAWWDLVRQEREEHALAVTASEERQQAEAERVASLPGYKKYPAEGGWWY